MHRHTDVPPSFAARHVARREKARWQPLVVALALLGSLVVVTGGAAQSAEGPELVVNGTFDDGLTGWNTKGAGQTLTLSTIAGSDSGAGAVRGSTTGTLSINDRINTVSGATKGTRYVVTARVRASNPNVAGQLRVREVAAAGVVTHGRSFWLSDTAWHDVTLEVDVTRDASALDLNVLAWKQPAGRTFYVDDVSMRQVVDDDQGNPPPADGPRLSNGCAYSERGIPDCGAYVGAAVGGNADPSAFEQEMGRRLGVRRTYFAASQVTSAVRTAEQDIAAGRLPWISFKLPDSWSRMASGAGDAWARDLSQRLAALDGPVWLAFHHEPEGDGAIADWVRMQERLGPIVRSTAPNVAFTIILTGWNQLYGPAQYSLSSLWPDTKVDVAGFDVYNSAYTYKNGVLRTKPLDIKTAYFDKFNAFVSARGAEWGLAETGYSDLAAVHDPDWIRQTYADLRASGGIAMAYFNSNLNSTQPWVLGPVAKRADFREALVTSPVLPKVE